MKHNTTFWVIGRQCLVSWLIFTDVSLPVAALQMSIYSTETGEVPSQVSPFRTEVLHLRRLLSASSFIQVTTDDYAPHFD